MRRLIDHLLIPQPRLCGIVPRVMALLDSPSTAVAIVDEIFSALCHSLRGRRRNPDPSFQESFFESNRECSTTAVIPDRRKSDSSARSDAKCTWPHMHATANEAEAEGKKCAAVCDIVGPRLKGRRSWAFARLRTERTLTKISWTMDVKTH